jgi:hypothetical protein
MCLGELADLARVDHGVDGPGHHGGRGGDGGCGHAVFGHDGHVIAAGHAVVVAVDGAAVRRQAGGSLPMNRAFSPVEIENERWSVN